jgi:hypothetical protein
LTHKTASGILNPMKINALPLERTKNLALARLSPSHLIRCVKYSCCIKYNAGCNGMNRERRFL